MRCVNQPAAHSYGAWCGVLRVTPECCYSAPESPRLAATEAPSSCWESATISRRSLVRRFVLLMVRRPTGIPRGLDVVGPQGLVVAVPAIPRTLRACVTSRPSALRGKPDRPGPLYRSLRVRNRPVRAGVIGQLRSLPRLLQLLLLPPPLRLLPLLRLLTLRPGRAEFLRVPSSVRRATTRRGRPEPRPAPLRR
jgi:hypothetical protein